MVEVKFDSWNTEEFIYPAHALNPILLGVFGSFITRGVIFDPHPLKMGIMGGEFQNWVGTSYLTDIDARQKDSQLSDT